MRILMVGAGVIGVTYAWQLSEAGHDVTMLGRPGASARIRTDGIHVRCTDLRSKPKRRTSTVYRPALAESHLTAGRFDLIVVSVRAHQLSAALAQIGEGDDDTDVVVFSNLWHGHGALTRSIAPQRVFYGFPHTVGGGRSHGAIETIIFAEHTRLGEVDGAMLEVGTPTAMSRDRGLVRRVLAAFREGMDVVRARHRAARGAPDAVAALAGTTVVGDACVPMVVQPRRRTCDARRTLRSWSR